MSVVPSCLRVIWIVYKGRYDCCIFSSGRKSLNQSKDGNKMPLGSSRLSLKVQMKGPLLIKALCLRDNCNRQARSEHTSRFETLRPFWSNSARQEIKLIFDFYFLLRPQSSGGVTGLKPNFLMGQNRSTTKIWTLEIECVTGQEKNTMACDSVLTWSFASWRLLSWVTLCGANAVKALTTTYLTQHVIYLFFVFFYSVMCLFLLGKHSKNQIIFPKHWVNVLLNAVQGAEAEVAPGDDSGSDEPAAESW